MNLCDPCETAGTCLKRGRCIFAANMPGISWWHVIVTMEKNGYTHSAIGAAIGVPRTTIEGWKNRNAEPAHMDGERLCALWRVVTGRPADELPRKLDQVLSAASFR